MKELLKAAGKSSAGTLITLLSSAVAIKIIALFGGPAAIGLFSLLRQIQQTASIVGSLGGQSAIVQGLADKSGDERALYTGIILRIIIISTGLVCVLIVLSAPWLGGWILGDLPGATIIFRLVAIPVVLGSGLLFLSGIINSHRAVGVLSLVQIAAGVSLASFSYAVSINSSGFKFLFLLGISSLAGLSVGIFFCKKNNWLGPLKAGWWLPAKKNENAKFIKVASATLLTGLMGMGSVLVVRALVSRYQGYAGAGIFDAGWTLSMTYVMLILTSFSAYYLPTLGKLKNQVQERNALILQYFKFATYASIPLIASIIVLKPWVIELLYSKDFLPATQMMRWMLLGDFFKIASWVMAMPMLAYADIKAYIVSEFLWSASFVFFSYTALKMGAGIEVIGMIFMGLYFLYFSYAYFYCTRKFKLALVASLRVTWVLGFIFLCIISYWAA